MHFFCRVNVKISKLIVIILKTLKNIAWWEYHSSCQEINISGNIWFAPRAFGLRMVFSCSVRFLLSEWLAAHTSSRRQSNKHCLGRIKGCQNQPTVALLSFWPEISWKQLLMQAAGDDGREDFAGSTKRVIVWETGSSLPSCREWMEFYTFTAAHAAREFPKSSSSTKTHMQAAQLFGGSCCFCVMCSACRHPSHRL
jgi:hypothetical protein